MASFHGSSESNQPALALGASHVQQRGVQGCQLVCPSTWEASSLREMYVELPNLNAALGRRQTCGMPRVPHAWQKQAAAAVLQRMLPKLHPEAEGATYQFICGFPVPHCLQPPARARARGMAVCWAASWT